MEEFACRLFPKKSPPPLGLSLELFCFGFFLDFSSLEMPALFCFCHGHLALSIAPELQEDDSSGLLKLICEKRAFSCHFLQKMHQFILSLIFSILQILVL